MRFESFHLLQKQNRKNKILFVYMFGITNIFFFPVQEVRPDAPKLSKKKLRRMNRLTVAELKQVNYYSSLLLLLFRIAPQDNNLSSNLSSCLFAPAGGPSRCGGDARCDGPGAQAAGPPKGHQEHGASSSPLVLQKEVSSGQERYREASI